LPISQKYKKAAPDSGRTESGAAFFVFKELKVTPEKPIEEFFRGMSTSSYAATVLLTATVTRLLLASQSTSTEQFSAI
jgi:hypothetical protein